MPMKHHFPGAPKKSKKRKHINDKQALLAKRLRKLEELAQLSAFKKQETKDGLAYDGIEGDYQTKIPLLIAAQRIDIDAAKTFSLPHPIEKIIDIDWSVESTSCRLIPSSRRLFVYGLLAADVQYVQAKTGEILNVKTYIPFQKIETAEQIKRFRSPEAVHKAKYIFQPLKDEEILIQREQRIVKNEQPICELQTADITSLEQIKKEFSETICLQISASLLFHILQPSVVTVTVYENKNE
jgi:hypothetical protein